MVIFGLRCIPFWRWQLPTYCRLYIYISNHQETQLNDWQSHCPSYAHHLYWIQVAQHTGNGQWTMLHKQGHPNPNGIHVCKPYHKLFPLSSEQGTCREISRNHQKLVLQRQGKGHPLHSPYGVEKHTPGWRPTITYADPTRKTSPYWLIFVTCSQDTNWYQSCT